MGDGGLVSLLLDCGWWAFVVLEVLNSNFKG